MNIQTKESERQRELEASRLENEQRQRAADSLFVDNGGSKKRGINSYLKASSGSRSSRRRG